ncbi:Radial spoke head 10-like protein B [Acropora cervicornis]|uniref:Radial spoke head 10-like protein B n=1 Tax=Acropora cervicornis TaxID=6130 RepID=A0AAD9QBC6_ACRCE|nr:Radial spoke head 10-like protein B [Acropora cervicornis]
MTVTNKNKMDCAYARNPFFNKQPKRGTNEDILRGTDVRPSIFAETDEFTDNSFWRHIPHGRGTLKTASGEPIYSGDWCKGKRHGKGKGVIFSLSTSGNVAAEHGVYSGEWKDNMRHGRGNMMFFSGAVYDGQWKFDEMTGYGTLTLPDGSIQEGIWRDGKLHGCAVFTWPHGVSEYREYDATRGLSSRKILRDCREEMAFVLLVFVCVCLKAEQSFYFVEGEAKGQLSSCTRERQTTNSMPQMVSIYPQLLSFQGTLSELIRERHFLRKDVAALKKENAEMITKAQIHTFEFRKRYQEQMVTSYEKERNEAEKALKAATEEAAQLKKELEETKAALVCQICFSRPRDCILLPCSHLLYCRDCVSEQRKNGDSRCPTCRGTINSEILCNINHPL